MPQLTPQDFQINKKKINKKKYSSVGASPKPRSSGRRRHRSEDCRYSLENA